MSNDSPLKCPFKKKIINSSPQISHTLSTQHAQSTTTPGVHHIMENNQEQHLNEENILGPTNNGVYEHDHIVIVNETPDMNLLVSILREESRGQYRQERQVRNPVPTGRLKFCLCSLLKTPTNRGLSLMLSPDDIVHYKIEVSGVCRDERNPESVGIVVAIKSNRSANTLRFLASKTLTANQLDAARRLTPIRSALMVEEKPIAIQYIWQNNHRETCDCNRWGQAN